MCATEKERCEGEQFVGTMVLSGKSFSTAQGEIGCSLRLWHLVVSIKVSWPIAPSLHVLLGGFPENGHYGGHGGIPGVRCNATGCSYRPSCACPWSVPSFNIRVTGPSTSLGEVFIPHPAGTPLPGDAKIVIAPELDEVSHFDVYAVAIGSDDSFHAGNNVNLNPPGWGIGQWGLLYCEFQRLMGSTCPVAILSLMMPDGSWFFGAQVFIGHPGKTYMGQQPDLRGIFQGLEHRPKDGPGSAPGGTTGVGTEWLKAFFQCKESIVSGTEFDPRIWY
eukprot:Skav231963  [mRNA]  locus=scaffold2806:190265:192377:+ [translate_table: standard]